MKINAVIFCGLFIFGINAWSMDDAEKRKNRLAEIEEINAQARRNSENSYAITGGVSSWTTGISASSTPLRKYTTNKGIFVYYTNNGLKGQDLKGPIRKLPDPTKFTNCEEFEWHLQEYCGFEIVKIDDLFSLEIL